MTHIFSTGLNQMRHVVHLAQRYDRSERAEGAPIIVGFLAVRLAVGDPSPPGQLYRFPTGNSPSLPRRFKIRGTT